jgi:hypothetical protein
MNIPMRDKVYARKFKKKVDSITFATIKKGNITPRSINTKATSNALRGLENRNMLFIFLE